METLSRVCANLYFFYIILQKSQKYLICYNCLFLKQKNNIRDIYKNKKRKRPNHDDDSAGGLNPQSPIPKADLLTPLK